MVNILQYINVLISNQHAIHLKFSQYYVSIISQLKKKTGRQSKCGKISFYTAITLDPGSHLRTALLAVRKICVPEAVGYAGLGSL